MFQGAFSSSRVLLLMVLLGVFAIAALPVWAEPGDAAVGDHTKSGQTSGPPATVPPSDALSTTPMGSTPGGAPATASEASWTGVRKVAIVIAVFVVPILLGNFLAKRLRMPDYGWKFSLAIGTLLAAAVIISLGEVKLGPDLSGGITLIYEVQREDNAAAKQQDTAGGDKNALVGDQNMAKLIKALTQRVDPSGTKEVSIKKFGEGQVEIIIPKAEKSELEAIERQIYTAGKLEFRIVASPKFSRHKNFIEMAKQLKPNQNTLRLNDRDIARWVEYDQDQFGSPERVEQSGMVVRMAGKTPQVLVMVDDGLDVTGDYLRSASPSQDDIGRPAVTFVFNQQGAFKFERLTREHQPNASGEKYNLGILLDNRLLSAPYLNAVISDRGIIEGLKDQKEVEFLVGILNAGSLPAALNKTPISRAQISPTLGKLTIERGQRSLAISLVLVAIFMVWYYKKAGFVAWLGLGANMLLILGCMVLIKAAFTLPGLAGLVLTVGMSVDANVLIYERLREELARGATLRMAIRNGFNRASQTIIDSNVTNLITGIVIYKIAPDSVKGFGVTLVLGIAMSVFTAVFLTRIVFDVAERRGWLGNNLSMRQFVGETHIDFIKWGPAWMIFSGIIIAIGLAAAFMRGRDMLDIDFTGGSSVTMVLKDSMSFADVDKVLRETPLATNLSLVEMSDDNGNYTGQRYTVTTINDNVTEVENTIAKAFGDKLLTYKVDVRDVKSITGGSPIGAALPGRSFGRELAAWPGSYLALLQAPPAGEQPAPAAEEPAAKGGGTAPAAEPPAAGGSASAVPNGDSTIAPPAPAADSAASAEAPADSAAKAGEASEPQSKESAADQSKPAAPTEVDPSAADPFSGGTSARLTFTVDEKNVEGSGVSHDTLAQLLSDALKQAGFADATFQITNPDPAYQAGSIRSFKDWDVKIALPQTDAQKALDILKAQTDQRPVFPLSNKIGDRVAGRMAYEALMAILFCLIGIIGYVWFRFHGVFYGIAAVVALVHDVLVTLGFVALSSYIVAAVPPLAHALMIDKFQIDLVLVAAFLTIIGYSLNDTIVIFDYIREVKGKSQRLTGDMINLAVNRTLARTILTSFTTLMSTIVLYIFGGEGIHAFAFALLVGFIAGCYSTIFIANPVLMWLTTAFEGAAARPAAKAAQMAPSAR
jgi:SecD/SecF fusion protein